MKKRGRTIILKINLSNRWLYFLITLGILAIVGIGVYAVDTSKAWHSAEDIEVRSEGEYKSLQDAINEGDFREEQEPLPSEWICPGGYPTLKAVNLDEDVYGTAKVIRYGSCKSSYDTCSLNDEDNMFSCPATSVASCKDSYQGSGGGLTICYQRTVDCNALRIASCYHA